MADLGSAVARRMLSFVHEKQRFNYRVAGIAIRSGHVLVCREDDDDYVMLPGGRVEFGEASDMALLREVQEELGCAGSVGPQVFSAENFFERDGETFHEIGMYYGLDLPEDFPFQTQGVCKTTFDEGHELSFSWVPIGAESLAKVNLLPEWLHVHLPQLPDRHRHVVVDER